MKCPECVDAGLESKVWVGMTTSTCLAAVPFYDEAGEYHFDDPNTHTTSYRCSNGHSFSTVVGR